MNHIKHQIGDLGKLIKQTISQYKLEGIKSSNLKTANLLEWNRSLPHVVLTDMTTCNSKIHRMFYTNLLHTNS